MYVCVFVSKTAGRSSSSASSAFKHHSQIERCARHCIVRKCCPISIFTKFMITVIILHLQIRLHRYGCVCALCAMCNCGFYSNSFSSIKCKSDKVQFMGYIKMTWKCLPDQFHFCRYIGIESNRLQSSGVVRIDLKQCTGTRPKKIYYIYVYAVSRFIVRTNIFLPVHLSPKRFHFISVTHRTRPQKPIVCVCVCEYFEESKYSGRQH